MRVLSLTLAILAAAEAFTVVQVRESRNQETKLWSAPDNHGVLEPYNHIPSTQLDFRRKEDPHDAIMPIHDTRQWSAPTVASPSGLVMQGLPPVISRRNPPQPQLKGQKFIIDTPKDMVRSQPKEITGGHKTPPLVSTMGEGLVGVQGGAPVGPGKIHYPGDQAKDDAMEPFNVALSEESFGEWSDVE